MLQHYSLEVIKEYHLEEQHLNLKVVFEFPKQCIACTNLALHAKTAHLNSVLVLWWFMFLSQLGGTVF